MITINNNNVPITDVKIELALKKTPLNIKFKTLITINKKLSFLNMVFTFTLINKELKK